MFCSRRAKAFFEKVQNVRKVKRGITRNLIQREDPVLFISKTGHFNLVFAEFYN